MRIEPEGDVVSIAAALFDVTLQPSFEADCGGCVDKHCRVIDIVQFIPVEGKEPFYDDDRLWFDDVAEDCASVAGEVIVRLLDCVTVAQACQVFLQQHMVDRLGRVEVDLLAFLEGQVVERTIIVVDSNDRSIEMLG